MHATVHLDSAFVHTIWLMSAADLLTILKYAAPKVKPGPTCLQHCLTVFAGSSCGGIPTAHWFLWIEWGNVGILPHCQNWSECSLRQECTQLSSSTVSYLPSVSDMKIRNCGWIVYRWWSSRWTFCKTHVFNFGLNFLFWIFHALTFVS